MVDAYEDIENKIQQGYYRNKQTTEIIRFFAISLPGKEFTPYLRAMAILELGKEGWDKVKGEVTVPFTPFQLHQYERIPDSEIEELRAKPSQLVESIQSDLPSQATHDFNYDYGQPGGPHIPSSYRDKVQSSQAETSSQR